MLRGPGVWTRNWLAVEEEEGKGKGVRWNLYNL